MPKAGATIKMKRDSPIWIFVNEAEKDKVGLVTKLQRWYNHGMSDTGLTEADLAGINAVEHVYRLLTDSTNMGNRMGIYHKIQQLYGFNSIAKVHTLVHIADALYLSERPVEKRFKKAMHEAYLLRMMEKAENDGDYKSAQRFSRDYMDLLGLDKDITEIENPFIETVIKLEANPQLIENYNADDRAETLARVKRLELKAKQKLTGQDE